MAQGEPFSETTIADALPRKYLPRYNFLFAKDFVVCVSTVVWKLQSPDHQELACVAEELALNSIIHQVEVSLELQGLEVNLDDVYEEAFQGTDFEFLLDSKFDGIEESEPAESSGMTNLRFEDWFTPFANVRYIHPYVADASGSIRLRRP